MSNSPNDGFLEADKDEVRKIFISTTLRSLIYTILWIPVFIIRCLLIAFVGKYKPSFGKPLDFADSTVEEDYSNNHPKNSLVFTLVLDRPLELLKFRQLFSNNVLEAKLSDKKTGEDKPRYPEFKQYQTDFAGYKFWRNDILFNITNHITEEPFSKKFQSLSKIHQEMINKKFLQKRSPWEIVLVNNYQNETEKALLIYRCHHTLGDTKSNLKMLVECLGQKSLKMPNVQYPGNSVLDKIHYYAWMPFYYIYTQMVGHFTALKGDSCVWKFKGEEEPLLNLAISKPVPMQDVKAIAKRHGVTTSAVIMAAVAGGIARSDKRLGKSGIPIQWVLPKIGHPDTLCNHSYSATMDLPTDLGSPLERLKKCNEIMMKMKASTLHKYDKAVVFQLGTWFNPLRVQFLRNNTFPLIVTNIASDGEGFQVGSSPCSQLSMTCAPLEGACGVIICGFSYKDVIEISATAKEGILTEAQTHKVTELMEKEFEVLKNAAK